MFAGLHSKLSRHFTFPFREISYICKGAVSPAGALKIVAACPMNRAATIWRRKDLVPSTVWGIRACLALPSKFTSKPQLSEQTPMEGLYRFCVYTVTKQIHTHTHTHIYIYIYIYIYTVKYYAYCNNMGQE